MTNREPDDLYDALRDRLTDYGQEPPAPLWAGIRAQLPPSVAPPQLRRRRRTPAVLLLLLLMAVASGTGWHWWQTQHQAEIASNAGTPGRRSSSGSHMAQPASPVAALPASNPISATQHVPPISQKSLSGSVALSNNTVSSSAASATESGKKMSADGDLVARDGQMGTSATARDKAISPTAIATPLDESAGIASEEVADRQKSRRAALAIAATRTRLANASTVVATQTNPSDRYKRETAKTTGASKTVAVAGRRYPAPVAGVLATSAAHRPRPSTSKQLPEHNSYDPASLTDGTQTGNPLAANPTNTPSPTPLPAAGSLPDERATADGEAAAQRVAEAALLARLVALQPVTWPAPAAPQPVEIPDRLRPFVKTWAIQVLAGPALTYRRLANEPLQALAAPLPSYTKVAATNTAGLERPALGSGAQINVRRTLTTHWNLSLGLGYTEYASRLALQQVRATALTNFIPLPDSSTTSIHRRDTYRFLTLPVRVGYDWALTPRWRMGMLAGADAALYLGGTTTDGSACACQTQTWGPTDSPYRRVSIGASLGAVVGYRLNGRWELLAQPTATYLLTPLARSATYTERHLFGGTALLGVSYDLH
jgi:hypothetical protein